MLALGVFHETLHIPPRPSVFIAQISISWVCAAAGYSALKHVSEMATSPVFCLTVLSPSEPPHLSLP